MAKVSFLFNDAQGQAFEAWYRDALTDGASWFECELKTPMGLMDYTCRFTDIYEGPREAGPNLWSYSAELELLERAVIGDDWGLFPDFLADQSIFDIAVNKLWPENPWQTYIGTFDLTINEEWPQL